MSDNSRNVKIPREEWLEGAVSHYQFHNRAQWIFGDGVRIGSAPLFGDALGIAEGRITVRPDFELLDEVERLHAALRELAASNAWLHFGDCRAWKTEGPILSPLEAEKLARRVLRNNEIEAAP